MWEGNVDYNHKYTKLDMAVLRFGRLSGKVDALLDSLVNEALDEGRWHRCGGTVFFSYHEEHCVIAVEATPRLDSLFSVVTGMALTGGFITRRVSRDTAMRVAKTCWY